MLTVHTLARALTEAGAAVRALDAHTALVRDRGRESIVEVLAHKIVTWTAGVPVDEVLVAEERGLFARVRREVELGDRAFDARFYLLGDVHRFLPHTRAALLDLDAPVEIRVRAGHAIARLRGDVHVVAHALLCVWDDLDPRPQGRLEQAPLAVRERPMHRGFAPDDLLPPASVDDIDAIAAEVGRASCPSLRAQ